MMFKKEMCKTKYFVTAIVAVCSLMFTGCQGVTSGVPNKEAENFKTLPITENAEPSNFESYKNALIETEKFDSYTFSLKADFLRKSEKEFLFRKMTFEVEKDGKAIKDDVNSSPVVFDQGSQYCDTLSSDYDSNSILTIFKMSQNGKEYPLAVVTYVVNENYGEGVKTVSRFFTIKDNMIAQFYEGGMINFENLASNPKLDGNKLVSNEKTLVFDFEKMSSEVI